MVVYKFDSNNYYLEDVEINDNDPIPSNCTPVKPLDGLYKAQFVNNTWIETRSESDILADLKEMKKAELDNNFNQTLMSGFTSSALGTSHSYPCDIQAMIFFNATFNRFQNDTTFLSIKQKTLDAGYISHNKDQFTQVYNDGHAFGITQDEKLAQLKSDTDAVTLTTDINQAKSDLDAIKW